MFVLNDTELISPSEAPTREFNAEEPRREATPTTAHKQDETTSLTITMNSGAHILLTPHPPSVSKSEAPRAVDGAAAAAAREAVDVAATLLVDRLAATAAAGSADSA